MDTPAALSEAARHTRRPGHTRGSWHRFFGATSEELWSLILSINAAYWLAIAVIEILSYWGQAGRMYEGSYVISGSARLLNYLLDFLISSIAFRWLLQLKDFDELLTRLRTVACHVLSALVCVWLMAICLQLVGGVVDHRWDDVRDPLHKLLTLQSGALEWAWTLRVILPHYLLALVLIAFVRLSRRHHEESLHLASVSADYAQTRLAILSAQLQPHFLFNALNVITELVAQSPERATEMLARLSDFLRHTLESGQQPWVSVQTEVAALDAYLAVQRARFGERLQIEIGVGADAGALIIPSLLLQPLVENAVRHGRAGQQPTVHVRIDCRVDGERLHVFISNSSPRLSVPLPPAAYGYGLQNVQSRLRAAYGDDAALTVGPAPAPQDGTLATVSMPARTTPPPLHDALLRERP